MFSWYSAMLPMGYVIDHAFQIDDIEENSVTDGLSRDRPSSTSAGRSALIPRSGSAVISAAGCHSGSIYREPTRSCDRVALAEHRGSCSGCGVRMQARHGSG